MANTEVCTRRIAHAHNADILVESMQPIAAVLYVVTLEVSTRLTAAAPSVDILACDLAKGLGRYKIKI